MISKVVHTVDVAEKMGIKIGWLDRVITDICARRDHLILIQKVEQLSTRLAELQKEASKVQRMLAEVCSEKSLKNRPPMPVDNYKIYIIDS